MNTIVSASLLNNSFTILLSSIMRRNVLVLRVPNIYIAISLRARWYQSSPIGTGRKNPSLDGFSHANRKRRARLLSLQSYIRVHALFDTQSATCLAPSSSIPTPEKSFLRTSCRHTHSKSTSDIFAYEGPNHGIQMPIPRYRLSLHKLMIDTVSACQRSLFLGPA